MWRYSRVARAAPHGVPERWAKSLRAKSPPFKTPRTSGENRRRQRVPISASASKWDFPKSPLGLDVAAIEFTARVNLAFTVPVNSPRSSEYVGTSHISFFFLFFSRTAVRPTRVCSEGAHGTSVDSGPSRQTYNFAKRFGLWWQ